MVEFSGAATLGGHTAAVSLHAHTNRSRESMSVMPAYLDRIPLVAPLVRREVRAYEQRNREAIDFSKGWWCPPVDAAGVLASETAQIRDRLGLQPIVSITDHDTIDAPLALHAAGAAPGLHPGSLGRFQASVDSVPLSVEWTVPFERGFLHLGVHHLAPARGEQIFAALSAHTQQPAFERLADLLDLLCGDPETLVVLNHPLWDLAGVGVAEHQALLRRFLEEHRGRIHGIEINGYRSWPENAGAIAIANAVSLPVISGGDRHGRAPNALLNLTNASSFGEFAREIREQRRSIVLVMPEYRQSLVTRKLAVASDALRQYPSYPPGQQRWVDRVWYEQNGQIYALGAEWPEGGPWWVRGAVRTFEIATSAPLLPAMRLLVWLAGASTSHRADDRIAVDTAAALPSSAAPSQEPIG